MEKQWKQWDEPKAGFPAALEGCGAWCHLLPHHCPVPCSCGQGDIVSLAAGSPSAKGCLSLLASCCPD